MFHPFLRQPQWQSTDWQNNNFLNQQNSPQQYTVTREVPPIPTQSQLPNSWYSPQSQQVNPGTPSMAPMQDCGRIAGSPNSTNGKNISITLNLNLGDGDNDEDDQGNNGYPNTSYGMNPVQGYQAPSWYQ
jgi:hypothetical protein